MCAILQLVSAPLNAYCKTEKTKYSTSNKGFLTLVQSHFVTLQIRNIAGFQLTKEVA